MHLEGTSSKTNSSKHFVTLHDGNSRRLIIELPRTWEDLLVATHEVFPHYIDISIEFSTKDLTITDGEHAVLNGAVWDDARTHIKCVTATPLVPPAHGTQAGSVNAALNVSARNVQDGLMLPPEDAYDQTPEPAGPSRLNDMHSNMADEQDEQHAPPLAPIPSSSRIPTHEPAIGFAVPGPSHSNGYHNSSNAIAHEETRSRTASTDSPTQSKRKRVESQSSQGVPSAPVAAPAPKRRANLNDELSRILPSRDEPSRGGRQLPSSPPPAPVRRAVGPQRPEPEPDVQVKLERNDHPVRVKTEKFNTQRDEKPIQSQSDDKFVVHIEYKGKKKAFRVRGGYTVWKVLNTACTNFSLPKPNGYDIMLCMPSDAGAVSCDNEDTLKNIGAVDGTVMELVGLGDDDDSDR